MKIILTKLLSHIKERGVSGTFLYALQKYLGITKLQDETTALFYFLDMFKSPQDIPRTKDEDLCLLQDCDTMLLGIFDKLCRKYGFTYWIEYGTLLGAIRHKGFIPWDDDADVAMPRKDFEKMYDSMHDELKNLGITLEYGNNELAWLQLHYRHSETGIWIDITPMDSFKSPYDLEETRAFLTPLITKYIDYYDSHLDSPIEKLWKKKEKLIFNHQSGGNNYLFHGQEFRQTKIRILREQDLIPCMRTEFNGIMLNIPANPVAYLEYVYSKKYMCFPHGGVEHHGNSLGRPPLSQWGKLNGVNMQEVYTYLKEIYEGIPEEATLR